MPRLTRALAGVAVAAAAAAPAAAQTVEFGTLCGTLNGATACADATAELFAGYLEVRLQNAQGPDLPGDVSRITGFGLYHVGGASMGGPGTLAGPIPGGGWRNGFVGGGGALANPGPQGTEAWLVAASVQGNGGIFGCTDPTGNASDVSSCAGPLTFRFDFASTAGIRMQELEFAFRAQSVGPTGESTKCYGGDAAGTAQACTSWQPPTVTPEPATVTLLAGGLLGLGGIALRRRRTTG